MSNKVTSQGVEEPTTCTVKELLNIIAYESGCIMLPDNDMDLVYPGIYIGDVSSARNRFILAGSRFTHLLNTAEGTGPFNVQTDKDIYDKLEIKYLGVEADDSGDFPLETYFDETSQFIDEALAAGGKILVHCREGVSRSATVVLAFLMLRRHMTAQDAVKTVHKHRNICPNDGFLLKLCQLNDKLAKQGHFNETPGTVDSSVDEQTIAAE